MCCVNHLNYWAWQIGPYTVLDRLRISRRSRGLLRPLNARAAGEIARAARLVRMMDGCLAQHTRSDGYAPLKHAGHRLESLALQAGSMTQLPVRSRHKDWAYRMVEPGVQELWFDLMVLFVCDVQAPERVGSLTWLHASL
jgi:hypothetical protein